MQIELTGANTYICGDTKYVRGQVYSVSKEDGAYLCSCFHGPIPYFVEVMTEAVAGATTGVTVNEVAVKVEEGKAKKGK